MACSRPFTAYRCADGSVVFDERLGDVTSTLYLPCGQCVLCRSARASEISTRLQQEACLHRDSVCVTLTYAPEHVPALGSVSKRDVQLWLKRLRFAAWRDRCERFRFDAISEYSPELMRPHYHACLFGYRPIDAVYFNRSRSGSLQFTSKELTDAWGLGLATFQDFSSGAADYCARHQSEKLTGRLSADRLAVRDRDGALLGWREPEFRLCSLRPGLGAGFFEKYGAQMLALDFCVVAGKKVPVPGYYLRLGERVNPDRVSELRALHELSAAQVAKDATYARLAVREQVATARLRAKARNGVERG